MPDTAPNHAARCLNCGHAFGAVRPAFCPACGQETNVRPPTLGEFAQQFGGSYIAAEGALWRTLALLFTKPGQLTREYLAGRRRHYVLPLRLYLTISLVALFALRLASSMQAQVEVSPEAAAEIAKANGGIDLIFGRATLRNGELVCENLPQRLCERLQRRLILDPKHISQELSQAQERFLAHWGTAMFLLVPMFAAWVQLAYRNRRMRYTEHLVFALHVHAFCFAAIALMIPLPTALSAGGTLALPIYALLAAQRVYGGRWWATVLRNAAVAMAYGLTLSLAMAVVAVWTFLG